MNIMKLFQEKARDNKNQRAVTMAFLGDSVTQGCFEVYKKADGHIETVFDKESAYHRYLAQIFALLYPNVPVNMINAGISGGVATHGLERLERDVLRYSPDLVVVCFGLNDCKGGIAKLPAYKEALQGIFRRLKEAGCEVIFMTPNMSNTSVSVFLIDETIREIAVQTQAVQTQGMLDTYLEEAVSVCRTENVTVCDCYAKWKVLERNGVDVTELLANKINHPRREMNWLFTISLLETMMNE